MKTGLQTFNFFMNFVLTNSDIIYLSRFLHYIYTNLINYLAKGIKLSLQLHIYFISVICLNNFPQQQREYNMPVFVILHHFELKKLNFSGFFKILLIFSNFLRVNGYVKGRYGLHIQCANYSKYLHVNCDYIYRYLHSY